MPRLSNRRALLPFLVPVLFLLLMASSAGQAGVRRRDPIARAVANAGSTRPGLPPVSMGDWSQMGQLVQAKGQYFGEFGFSVAIDRDTIVVSNILYSEAFVFLRPSQGWRNMLPTATLSLPSGSGPVAISGDTIVVGSSVFNTGSGAAYVFVKPAGGWTNMTPTATLTASDAMDTRFGTSAAIHGNTVVIGDSIQNSFTGAAYVFVKPSTGWADMTQTAKLTASDGQPNDSFGGVVSLNNNLIAVGAPQNALETGKAYVFVKPHGGWVDTTQTAELTASGAKAAYAVGSSISVGNDAVVVGAPCSTDAVLLGKAYVFVKPPGGWANETQAATLSAIDARGTPLFGIAVLMSGETVLVGAGFRGAGPNSEEGGVYVFEEPSTGWKDAAGNIVLTASGARQFTWLGNSLGLSGNVMVVGAPVLNLQGAAYVFERP